MLFLSVKLLKHLLWYDKTFTARTVIIKSFGRPSMAGKLKWLHHWRLKQKNEAQQRIPGLTCSKANAKLSCVPPAPRNEWASFQLRLFHWLYLDPESKRIRSAFRKLFWTNTYCYVSTDDTVRLLHCVADVTIHWRQYLTWKKLLKSNVEHITKQSSEH